MKTGLQDRLRASQRDRVAPDTGPMTGSINNQQPSTTRGEAQGAVSHAIGARHMGYPTGCWVLLFDVAGGMAVVSGQRVL
jgi:hypothetical protein